MITIELKDQILSALCCSNIPYECHCSIYKSSFSEDISEPYTEDELVAVLSQFRSKCKRNKNNKQIVCGFP